MAKITIIDGNDEIELSTAPKENIKAYMVKGESGSDGVSPIATVSKVDDTTTITITDKNGTTSSDVVDGFDPTVTASKSGKTTTITITDIDGTRTTEIEDGSDLTGGVPTDGVLGWDNDDLVYICDGTETGDYYLTYNSTDYYFTMPTVEDGDGLLFNTTSLELSLNGTTITTSSSGTGTELTFTDYVPNGYELTNPIPTVVDTYSTSTTDGYSANYLNDKLIKDKTTIKNLTVGEIESKNKVKLKPASTAISGVKMISNQDGSILLNGTSTAEILMSNSFFKNNSFILEAGTYTMSFSGRTQTEPIALRKKTNDTNIAIFNAQDYSSFTLSEATEVYIGIYIYNKTFNNEKLLFQIEKGDTQSNYTPHIAFDNNPYVLWTNPNPTSSFAEQVVTLSDDLDNYTYLEIISRQSTSSGNMITSGKLPIDAVALTTYFPLHYNMYRVFVTTSKTFRNNSYWSSYGDINSTTRDNNYNIPIQILGYK